MGRVAGGTCCHSGAISAGRGTGIFEDAAVTAKRQALREELAGLARMERTLDQLLQDCALQLRQLAGDKANQRYPCWGARGGRTGAWGQGFGDPSEPLFSSWLPLGWEG